MNTLRTNIPQKQNRKLSTINETEEFRRGELLAEVLGLRHDRDEKDRWPTTWGTKTSLGLYRTVKRIIDEGE